MQPALSLVVHPIYRASDAAAARSWMEFVVAELSYIRMAEEQEMVARFGVQYLAYRRRVPFIIPQLRRRG